MNKIKEILRPMLIFTLYFIIASLLTTILEMSFNINYQVGLLIAMIPTYPIYYHFINN